MRELLVGSAIVAIGAMISSPGYSQQCEGRGDWCEPTGNCDTGSGGGGGDPPRKHEHESGGPGCTGFQGDAGSCSGSHEGMSWTIQCSPPSGPFQGICWMTLKCPGGKKMTPTKQGIRCDNSTCIVRADNHCYAHTCEEGASELSCSGLGIH